MTYTAEQIDAAIRQEIGKFEEDGCVPRTKFNYLRDRILEVVQDRGDTVPASDVDGREGAQS